MRFIPIFIPMITHLQHFENLKQIEMKYDNSADWREVRDLRDCIEKILYRK
jgi:hypothetical protein